MAIVYPYYTTPKTFYVIGVPFSNTTASGGTTTSVWKDCQLRLDGYNNSTRVITGAFYFISTTTLSTYLYDNYGLNYIYAGTAFSKFASPYWCSVGYTLRFNCYDSNKNLIGNVIPINLKLIYQPTDSTGGSGRMYNWRTNAESGVKTWEPWVVRYASDNTGNVFTPLPIYTSPAAKFTYPNYVNGTYPIQRTPPNNGWQPFSITLPQGTASFSVDFLIISNPNAYPLNYELKHTEQLYSQNVDPIIVDNPSKIGRKPASQNQFTRNGVILYKAANSTTWEKKYIYKKTANSTTWTKV